MPIKLPFCKTPYNLIFFMVVVYLFTACTVKDDKYTGWKVTGGTKEGIRYSSLTEINASNIATLKVAWEYHTGDADTVNKSQIQCNPIMVDGIVFGTSPQLKLIALDAATGNEKWVFDPKNPGQKLRAIDFILNNNRGVAYWTDGSEKRILYVVGSHLHAVDAATGKLITSFGNEGKVDLHEGLGRDVSNLYVAATSPGIVYKDLLILGTRVSEGTDAAPGHIRAFNVRSGKQEWIFHTIPQPGEYGHETWDDPQAYKFIGGANSWSGFTMDEKRGIVFAPTGSASFDFYGGKRKGQTLFANCLLALDAATGKRIWHYQFIHHDVWDRDLPTAPALVTVTHSGQQIEAVAQPTKTGFIYLFDRETGKSLFEIREQPVPTDSVIEGEKLWPTQPIPVLPEPFARQTFNEEDLNDLLPDSSFQDLRDRYRSYKKGNLFTPPSKEGTIFFPGLDGGAEWGGPAFDPETGIVYVNANEMPWVITLVEAGARKQKDETNLSAGISLYQQNCSSCHAANFEGSGNYPSLKNLQTRYKPEEFKSLVASGRRMMPAFKHLTDEERHAIASYVLNLKDEQKKKFVVTGKEEDDPSRVPYTITGYNKFMSKEHYPAIKPPWGTLSAINLNTGKLVWRVPLGEDQYFKQKGIVTGTENYGGPLVTASGLVFIAATPDSKLRAFDKSNGKIVWETTLPAPAFATPAMYEFAGKQYLVVACGGGKLRTKSGDSYVAFALP
jgi:quinoprotein glucose dehydrogenase